LGITGWDAGRGVILLGMIVVLFFSQRYFLRILIALKKHEKQSGSKFALRALCAALVVLLVATFILLREGVIPRGAFVAPLLGLWFASAFFAYLAVKLVHAVEWAWHCLQEFRAHRGKRAEGARFIVPLRRASFQAAQLENPQRRYFFQRAARVAGAVPFVGALYGFAAERLQYQVERVEIPIPNLPPELDGLRIAQLSDIHIGAYMPRRHVRRAVQMMNELGADLSVVTGDFITTARDPLEECVTEVGNLRAPLGVWGCLGNHEIYANCEDETTEMLRRVGVRVLRQQNAEIRWNGGVLNLIGVDYQRSRGFHGARLTMLDGAERLVRRDAPNILLSHNPNAFERAPELGIELTLAGHTHGGQVSVEILDRSINPARFMTDWVAGLYQRGVAGAESPAASASGPNRQSSSLVTGHPSFATSCLYVNRGLGTVGAPVRLGAPPEITLLTLRRA